MKTHLIFSLSVALIFLSMNIMTFGQEKPVTTAKNKTQTQEKQITKTATTHHMSNIKDKALNNKKMDKKTAKTDMKKLKNETDKNLNKKDMVHHKKMEKKTLKKESNTPQKK